MSGGSSTNFDATSPGSASNLLASIVNSQYANYGAVFKPIENKLIKYATDPNTVINSQRQAMAQAGQSFDAGTQGLAKGLETSGVTLTPQQQQSVSRQRSTQRGLSEIDAANRTGQQTYDTVTGILSGAAPNPTGIVGGVNTSSPAGGGG